MKILGLKTLKADYNDIARVRETLRGLVYAPVSLAVSAAVGEECAKRFQAGEVPGVRRAFVTNGRSRVLLVELDQNIAGQVLAEAKKLGAAPYPVGAESKYELAPMFYRVSGTFRAGPGPAGPGV